jgi:Fur family ferric uptake transcriptional regulator
MYDMVDANMKRNESLKERVRSAGLRATPGRLALAGFFEKAGHPVGTPELSARFVPDTFDLATLYRTLKSFEAGGLLRSVPLHAQYASYEWVEHEGEHHHHLVCTGCGSIAEIPECDLEALESRVLKGAKEFAEIRSHSLEFFGRCRACIRKS